MAVHVTRTGVALTVGIIILGLLAFGGLYAVKQQGEQAQRNEAIAIAEQRLEAEADKDVALNGNDEVTDERSSESGQSTESGTDTSSQQGAESAGVLPQTGAGDIWMAPLVGLLTYFVVSGLMARAQGAKSIAL